MIKTLEHALKNDVVIPFRKVKTDDKTILFSLEFEDKYGNYKEVNILIEKYNDYYHCFTSDNLAVKISNVKKFKTVNAVKNYIYKFIYN